MNTRDDKLLAVIGLLCACLITVILMFILTWITDVRLHAELSAPDTDSVGQSCLKTTESPD